MGRCRIVRLAVVVGLMLSGAAYAARLRSWSFSTQKDFSEGRFENVVVDSYGELTLGRTLKAIPAAGAGESVQAFAQTKDGAVYVATSPDAKIYRIQDGKTTVVYTVPAGFDDITAMTADAKGNLWVALSGESARLISLVPGASPEKSAATTRFENKDVEYIWAIKEGADGGIYMGTGPHGRVYKVVAEGEPTVVVETGQKNVTALAFDKANNLMVGTDAHGLVIRVDAATNKPFVLLDAGKVDVNAMITDSEGNLYVATAKAEMPDHSGLGGEGSGGGGPEEPETKSKPGLPEKEPIEPPVEDQGKAGSPQGRGPVDPGIRTILGAVEPDLSAELKALLKKAATEKPSKNAGAPKHKPDSATTRSAKMMGKAAHLEESNSSEDVSGVYRIAADGLVTTLVQDQGNNYSLLLAGGELLIGTGDEGKLFAYRIADESLALIARVKEQQISTLFTDRDGKLLLGTGNMAQVYEMGAAAAQTGAFTSQVLDAEHVASWGHAIMDTTVPEGAKVTVATRSGNTHDVDAHGKFWSDWVETGESSKIGSPMGRFLQFRVTLSAGSKSHVPTVSAVRLGYQTRNLPPRIKNVGVELPGGGEDADILNHSEETSLPPEPSSHISWEASDPNGDGMLYRLYYKQVTAEDKDVWTPLARGLKEEEYEWDTRAVPDGKYQVKVVASDSPDNAAGEALEAARTSATFIIDHTPPAMTDLAATVEGNKATVTGSAKDGLLAVTEVRYQVDRGVDGQIGGGDWQPAVASDKIFDSPEESFTLVTRPLSVGPHRITVRATDAAGNSSYKAVTIIVKS